MLSPKQLLINCITLLTLEHTPGVSTVASKEIIGEVLESLPLPETTVDFDHSRQTFLELRSILLWLLALPEGSFAETSEILQRARVACREESYLYEAIAQVLEANYDSVDAVSKKIQSYRYSLNNYLNENKITEILKEYHHKTVFKRNQVTDMLSLVTEMGERLEPYVNGRERARHRALVGEISTTKPDSLAEILAKAKASSSIEGVLQSGWKGLNRALGRSGGFSRGTFCVVGGLQHNFKTGFMLSVLTHMAMFNTPAMADPTKKPLLLFLSMENELDVNITWIYQYLKENETGEPVVLAEIDPAAASQYVLERLQATGYTVKMLRLDPDEINLPEFIQFIDSFHADGYEIHAILCDYLNMLSKAGIQTRVAGDDVIRVFRRVRNYCSPRGIFFLTPHQLSSDALQLTRDNVEDFVKMVAGKGYYDGCRRLGQDPDLELFIHIVSVNGKSYLTVQRGKHRGVVTPERDRYFVLPFQDVGTIPWDVDKDDEITLSSPGGGAFGDPAAVGAWWE